MLTGCFFCFADSRSHEYGHTHEAFIFSLENRETLPPFKCLATSETKAIYNNLVYGPSFGETLCLVIEGDRAKQSRAVIDAPYSPPIEVADKESVLAGTTGFFCPDNYEVFYLV